MGAKHRARTRGGAPAVILAGILVALVGGCGTAVPGSAGGTPEPATSSGSVTSHEPSSTSSTSKVPTDDIVPASVLETSLATKILAKSYSVDTTDSGDYPTTGGLDLSAFGEYVSGDPGCRAVFDPHSVSPEAFAFVAMSNKSAWFEEVAESYRTVADAQKVMAENAAEARTCHAFKMRDAGSGEVVPYRHTATAAKNGDVDLFMHHFNGQTKKYVYEVHLFEGRVGGELMNIKWGSISFRADPSSAAFTQFQKVINAYRKDHTRQGSGVGNGVPTVAAPPSETALPRHRTASLKLMAHRVAR